MRHFKTKHALALLFATTFVASIATASQDVTEPVAVKTTKVEAVEPPTFTSKDIVPTFDGIVGSDVAVIDDTESIDDTKGIEAGDIAKLVDANEVNTLVSSILLTDAAARDKLISLHRPSAITTSHQSVVPPIVRVKLLRLRAIAFEAVGDYEAARTNLEICVGLGDETIDNWQRLGRARLRTGDFDGSRAAFLAAFQLSLARDQSQTDERASILLQLGELHILMGQDGEASRVLAAAHELAPSLARVNDLTNRIELASQGAPDSKKRVQMPFWPETPSQAVRARIEGWLESAHVALPVAMRPALARVGQFAISPNGRDIGMSVIVGLAILIAALRRLRGHGDLVIAIEYPLELRGAFTVRISEQPGQHKRAKSSEASSTVVREGFSKRTVHQNVGRETQFQGLIPKIYYVAVDGVLMDPDNGEVLLRPFDEHAVVVSNGKTVRLEFDMQPRECPVDVQVFWDKQPTEDAGVAARSIPNSLRYTRDGAARLRLCMGSHTIIVGSGDRVAEREIEVTSYSPTTVAIDLAGSEGVIFKGCPPAVKPYLHGDHNAAARALSRDGHTRIANTLLARLHCDLGQNDRAADHFKAAGQPLAAAELRARLHDYAGAALLFEEAGKTKRAAEMHREGGEWLKAGVAFESIDDFHTAADCYKRAEEVGRWLGALESNGDYFDAAAIALEHSDRARAIRLLQLVPLDSPNYPNACELLADAFEHEGHADLAAQKIEQCIEAGVGTPDLLSRLGTLLETCGDTSRALEALESLRDDEPTYPNIASRIESLRKKITLQSLSQTPSAPSYPTAATPTAFLSEKRYEIVSELGRGGMGVVFKARDLRLNREVALKQLPENLRDHPKAIQLFLREAQACARLNHRNIVTIFDTDQDDVNFFITMELLHGYPLNVIRRKRGRIAVRDAARLGVQVSEGLHYAHNQGIVHRDIKTANLFFTTDKVVKIMDFGLAKMMEEVRRGTTVLGGTPYYMSPEQAQGGTVDQRADIYSFGVTLYELVTGGVPFSEGDVSYHHSHTPVTDPRERAPDISDDMAELILHMLEKNPNQRCSSAEEVRRRLQDIANQPPG